jgi:hypothetical protein
VSPPDTEGRLKIGLSDPVRGEVDAQGFLSDIRGSARLRSGTMVYSGNFEGVRVNTVAPEAALYTITADLDVIGNVISFGSLSDDPATAGAALQFLDDGETATLASSLGRPAAQWWWYRAGINNTPAQPAMGLDAGNRLKLADPQEPAASGVVLDPAVDGVSRFQGAVTVDGVLILTTPAGGISMGEFE